MVSICGGLGFAVVVSYWKAKSAWGALSLALKAEAIKIALLVILMWLVLATFEDVVAVEFIGSFIVSVAISTMAILVPEHQETSE